VVIFNLSGKINAFVAVLHLKNEANFTWRAEQQHTFDNIKRYLSLLPMMKAPKADIPSWLYIAVEDSVIGAILTQVMMARSTSLHT
jgi:hypothetical protein